MVTEPSAVEVISGKGHKVLHLRGSVGIANGRMLRDAALKMAVGPTGADASHRVHIDMSDLQGVDVAAIQILAAMDAECVRRGRTIEVAGLRDAVRQQWIRAGWQGIGAEANAKLREL